MESNYFLNDFGKRIERHETIEFGNKIDELVCGPLAIKRLDFESGIRDCIGQKYNIPKKWWGAVYERATKNYASVSFGVGLPQLELVWDGEELTTRIIITDKKDVNNPYNTDFFGCVQNNCGERPCGPIPNKDNLRKLDSHPVWERNKKHLCITLKRLAGLLGYGPVTVQKKLSELDQELGY